MNESPPILKAERPVIREFIQSHRQLLEQAQAQGTLARTRLDLRDMAEARFSAAGEQDAARLLRMFEEELDAFLSDMRLATVTVQHQVEREIQRPPQTGKAIGLGIVAAVVTFGIALAIIKPTAPDPVIMLGFFSPIIIGLIVFFQTR